MTTTKTPPWSVCFGLETEIGIAVVEDPEADVVEESIKLVRAAARYGLANLWDYATEDPHNDARGFRVTHLLQDTDESNYVAQDTQRELTFYEIKSDLVLRNGARFYNDHAHPEYSTPECATLQELIAQDKAGERILEECARQASRHAGRTIRLYKNNTDFRGHSYGCHDNFLIPRSIPWERLVEAMTPFLVTRQLYSGAGKVGWESENATIGGGFQISQRADFFTELISIDTMNRRPIINTRDEPHADPTTYRRFHVIIGDANLSEFATWLKMGTTALVLESLAEDSIPKAWLLADPIKANRDISHDPEFKWEIQLANGKKTTAVELQLRFVEWVAQRVDLSHPEKKKVWQDWKDTLETLAITPLQCRDRLDWTAKYFLLDEFRHSENIAWTDPWLQSLDLEYHLLKREESLYYALESSGQMHRLVSEAEIIHALQQPPTSTRAYLRGKCVQKFGKAIKTAQWENLILEHAGKEYRLDLNRAFAGLELESLVAAIDSSPTIADFVKHLPLKEEVLPFPTDLDPP